jgi:hypothetical protein
LLLKDFTEITTGFTTIQKWTNNLVITAHSKVARQMAVRETDFGHHFVLFALGQNMKDVDTVGIRVEKMQ